MPYCDVGKYKSKSREPHGSEVTDSKTEESVRIFYRRYGVGHTKVLFIIGLAGTHQSWGPQVAGLCGTHTPHHGEDTESRNRGDDGALDSQGSSIEDCSSKFSEYDRKSEYDSREQTGNGIEVCTFDNRGVGKSSTPKQKSDYSTKTMAEDALALLDHLGWDKAHICGHSMGGMIACKLAAIAPHRLSSLTLIGVTGGGYQCLPKFNTTSFSIAYRIYRAKTPEERSAVDLDTHYTSDYLEAMVGERKRRALLYEEYVKNLLAAGMQPRHGLEGQVSACWNHSLTSEEVATIRSAGVIVAIVHGREDVIAQVEHARKLAKKLHPVSRMVELPGGHLVTHQNTDAVNKVLLDVIRAVSMNVQCSELKESEPGMYNTKGGDHWQTGETDEGNLNVKAVADLPLQNTLNISGIAPLVARATYWRKTLLPEWLDLLYVVPSLQWTYEVFEFHTIWKR